MPSGLVTCIPDNRISSSVLPGQSTGSAVLYAAVGDGQGSFSHLHDPGPALSPATVSKEWEGKVSLLHPCYHMADKGVGVSSAVVMPTMGLALACCPGKVHA